MPTPDGFAQVLLEPLFEPFVHGALIAGRKSPFGLREHFWHVFRAPFCFITDTLGKRFAGQGLPGRKQAHTRSQVLSLLVHDAHTTRTPPWDLHQLCLIIRGWRKFYFYCWWMLTEYPGLGWGWIRDARNITTFVIRAEAIRVVRIGWRWWCIESLAIFVGSPSGKLSRTRPDRRAQGQGGGRGLMSAKRIIHKTSKKGALVCRAERSRQLLLYFLGEKMFH
jgi:hypothetical protein